MYRVCVFGALLVTAGLLGCSGSAPPKGPAAAPVQGTVTLDGKPMAGGEVRFNAPGFPPKTLEIKDGTFSGEAFTGSNRVDVVWDKDGPPNPTDPHTKMKVNAVASRFSGPNSMLNADIPAGGKTDLKFTVTSARK